MFSSQTYSQRRYKLKQLVTNGLGLFLGNSDLPMNYTDNTYHFRQDSSFLYFFGIDAPGLAAIIDFETGNEYLFGNDVDIEDIIWMGEQPTLVQKAQLVGVDNALPFAKLATMLSDAIGAGRKVHYLPPYRAENKLLLNSLLGIKIPYLANYRSLQLVKAVVALRSVKEPDEVAEIEKACAIGYQMHVTAMEMATANVWEYEIAGTIGGIPLKHGVQGSFPIILSQNGQILHNHTHNQILQNGRLLIVDAGAESPMHYASDFTRTIPVGGKFSDQQKEIYQIVLDANNAATALAKPGVTYQSVHLQVCKVIANGLKQLGLMQGNVDDAVEAGAHAMFFPHGLGHMMGLDVHDMEDLGQIYVGYDDQTRPINQFGTAYLRLGRKLEPGFVITNEPGIYFIPQLIDKWRAEKTNAAFINFANVEKYRGFGGIRLEDDLLITPNGASILGNRVPITINEVEHTVGKPL
jgi:Xaa-Pro aminopeptidase